MYDKKMDNAILEIIRCCHPTLTVKEIEICRQVTRDMWDFEDIRSDIENGYI